MASHLRRAGKSATRVLVLPLGCWHAALGEINCGGMTRAAAANYVGARARVERSQRSPRSPPSFDCVAPAYVRQ